MKTFSTITYLPISIEEAWGFFSRPENLSKITPPSMNFKILNKKLPEEIWAGMEIDYTVSPLLRIPMKWKTEIILAEKPFRFIDRQKSGPYKVWEHEHRFKAVADGVEMQDIVEYEAPMGWAGQFAEWLFINRKVQHIFKYREKALNKIFNIK